MTLLSDAEIEKRLAILRGWRREGLDRAGVPGAPGVPAVIVREYKLDDFVSAIALVNRVAELAEQANHHPDIHVHSWNNVRLTLSTHSEGGLTEADFELATRIDQLA
jgi:4a-hydroxytetrahydrobiopterin dehydratase